MVKIKQVVGYTVEKKRPQLRREGEAMNVIATHRLIYRIRLAAL